MNIEKTSTVPLVNADVSHPRGPPISTTSLEAGMPGPEQQPTKGLHGRDPVRHPLS